MHGEAGGRDTLTKSARRERDEQVRENEREREHVEFEGRRLLLKSRKELRLKRAWRGAIVRSRRALANRRGALPAGTYWYVADSRGGLEMVSMPCRCCRFRIPIRKISESDVQYVGHPSGFDDGPMSLTNAADATAAWRINGPEAAGDQRTAPASSKSTPGYAGREPKRSHS